jgi:hypothetical protein
MEMFWNLGFSKMKTDIFSVGNPCVEFSCRRFVFGNPWGFFIRFDLFHQLLFTVIFLSGSLYLSVAAQTSWHKAWEIQQSAKWIAADQLRQLYVVTPSNEVIKYNAEGLELYRYNNNTLGTLQYIDPTDPFSLLLYYPDYQVVQVLDRTLNLLAEFKLWQYGIFQPRAIGMANDNQLWIYDEAVFRLKKLDPTGRVLAQSDDMNLLLGRQPRPAMLLVRQNRLWLPDPELGILVFDNFGQYSHTIPLKGVSQIRILDDRYLWCFVKDKWEGFDFRTFQLREFNIPEFLTTPPQTIIFPDCLYTVGQNSVSAWKP